MDKATMSMATGEAICSGITDALDTSIEESVTDVRKKLGCEHGNEFVYDEFWVVGSKCGCKPTTAQFFLMLSRDYDE